MIVSRAANFLRVKDLFRLIRFRFHAQPTDNFRRRVVTFVVKTTEIDGS